MAVGVCVIGSGDMGGQHARAWQARDDCDVLAVFDPIEERRNALAAEVGATAYETYEDAITHDGVDVVSVCTPTCFHAEIAQCAALQGRHVLCEKPIALNLEDADAMIAAARDNGVLLSISLQCRSFPRNRRMKELISAGAFGSPLFLRYVDVRDVRPKIAMHRRAMNNGPVLDMLCHFVDTARFLTGTEPESVFATGHVFGRDHPRLAEVDDIAIDAAEVQVRFTGGHVLSAFI
ncbi:MAG TPA: Gfo/Idh/MocA family oxidoreductase, partial [Candidatus Hydrogenedentes bacterium]|nr:Gfo/Idh/MocA family oxidoreductase [Candidatus Hydrogenedentota bacterium]